MIRGPVNDILFRIIILRLLILAHTHTLVFSVDAIDVREEQLLHQILFVLVFSRVAEIINDFIVICQPT